MCAMRLLPAVCLLLGASGHVFDEMPWWKHKAKHVQSWDWQKQMGHHLERLIPGDYCKEKCRASDAEKEAELRGKVRKAESDKNTCEAALKKKKEEGRKLERRWKDEVHKSQGAAKKVDALRSQLEAIQQRSEEAATRCEASTQTTGSDEATTKKESVPSVGPTTGPSTSAPHDWTRRLGLTITVVLGTLCLYWSYQAEQLKHELCAKEAALAKVQARNDELEHDFEVEFGDVMKVTEPHGTFGWEFSYRILDDKIDDEPVRFIKIQCPGVKHSDVKIHLLFNGCRVEIDRPASRGVEALRWRCPFQFRPSDGLFEVKEDQIKLENGFLEIVLRGAAFRDRVFRFPQHYDLSEYDTEGPWTFGADGAPIASPAEPDSPVAAMGALPLGASVAPSEEGGEEEAAAETQELQEGRVEALADRAVEYVQEVEDCETSTVASADFEKVHEEFPADMSASFPCPPTFTGSHSRAMSESTGSQVPSGASG